MNRLIYFAIAILAALIVYLWIIKPSKTEVRPDSLTISTVTYGPFSEYIPQTGIISKDTIGDAHYLKVSIDELHLPRIAMGRKATTQIDDTTYVASISFIYQRVVDGRVTIDMNFLGQSPQNVKDGEPVPVRLELSESSNETLLPKGDFYWDTGGKWVYVIQDDNHAVKRNVRIGRKNLDYFEVLEGLQPGDKVITSSYREFKDQESVELGSKSSD